MSQKKQKSRVRKPAAEAAPTLPASPAPAVEPAGRVEVANLISEFSQTVHSSLAFETVAARALEGICDYAAAPAAMLYILEEGTLRLRGQWGLADAMTRVVRTLPLERSLEGACADKGEIITGRAIAIEPQLYPATREMLLKTGFAGNIIALPLRLQESILGVISLVYQQAHALPAGAQQTLTALATIAAVALGNARHVAGLEQEARRKGQKQDSQLDMTKQVAEDRQRLIDLLEATSDLVATVDWDGNFVFGNAQSYKLLEVPEDEELQGQPLSRFLTQEANVLLQAALATALEEGIWQGEMTLETWTGRELPVSQVLTVHRAADGTPLYFSTIARDITSIRETLKRRSRQVQVTTEIAQRIALADELGELYEQVVTQVQEQFGYYHTQLLRMDEGSDVLRLAYGYGETGRQMLAEGYTIPMGIGLAGQAAARKQTVLRPDLSQEGTWRSHPLLPETVGEMAVPIQLGNEVLGILDVQSDKKGQLSEEDQLVLEGLCGQIAVTMETTRLRQETTTRLQELTNLQRLMSREGWQELRMTRPSERLAYLFDHTVVQPMNLQALLPGSNGKSNGNPAGEAPDPLISFPLRIRGEVIGTLGVEDNAQNPLSDEERDLLNAVSVQVAEALENARLLEQTQKRAVELETVSRVGAATSTILESERLLEAVVDLTKQSFNLYHAHIYLLDEAAEQLVLVAGAGHVGEIMKSEGWRIGLSQRSLVARAATTRHGVIANDVRREEGFLPNPLLPATRSELAVPMIASNRLLGVLDVQSDQPNYFTEADIRIQTAMATQIAVALQNAMLFEEQLETAEKLREVERLKSDFLASMSHELRTPLNSIIGFADVLLEGLDGELTDRMAEDVQLIRDSGQYLRELIGDILDMSKIEAGKMRLRYELIGIAGLVEEIMANARTLALSYKKEHLALSADVASEVTSVYADRTRLKQVLYNLLSNAIKFTEEGGVKIMMRYEGEWLVAGVQDTGIGIREENLGLIFEQFRQVDNSLTSTMAGTGLGLPISKSLILLHGGEIWVESQPGKGTTFWLKIPRNGPSHQLPDTGPLLPGRLTLSDN